MFSHGTSFRGRDALFGIVLATIFLPPIVTILLYHTPTIGLDGTLAAVIVPNLANAFGIFLLRHYIAGVLDELVEAARLDGASRLNISSGAEASASFHLKFARSLSITASTATCACSRDAAAARLVLTTAVAFARDVAVRLRPALSHPDDGRDRWSLPTFDRTFAVSSVLPTPRGGGRRIHSRTRRNLAIRFRGWSVPPPKFPIGWLNCCARSPCRRDDR